MSPGPRRWEHPSAGSSPRWIRVRTGVRTGRRGVASADAASRRAVVNSCRRTRACPLSVRPQAAADLGATSLGGVARGPARVALAVRKAAPGRRLQERGGGPTGSIHWPGDVIGGATGVLFAALWEPVGERTRDPLLKWGDPHVRRDLRDQFLPGPRSGPTAWSASTWVGGLCGWRDGRDLATRHRAPQRGATAPGGWGRRISSEPMVPDLRFLWQPHPQLEERATSMGVVRGAAREGSPLGFPPPDSSRSRWVAGWLRTPNPAPSSRHPLEGSSLEPGWRFPFRGGVPA